MPDYVDFFLRSAATIVQYETIELSHPNFSKVHRVVRNNAKGLMAFLEDATEVYFQYYPLIISPSESTDDLDYAVSIEFGDLGDILPAELDLVASADGFDTKPVFKYRTYRSDDLSAPMFGPIALEIKTMSFTKDGAKFEAIATKANLTQTGNVYRVIDFPTMEGFLK